MQSSLSKNQFSDEEISLTLYSNEYSVPLTLVDLPGLIVKPPEGSRATTALLRHYGNRSGSRCTGLRGPGVLCSSRRSAGLGGGQSARRSHTQSVCLRWAIVVRTGCILLAVMIAGNDLSTDFLFHEDNLSSLENSPEKRTMAVFTRMDRLQCPVQRGPPSLHRLLFACRQPPPCPRPDRVVVAGG